MRQLVREFVVAKRLSERRQREAVSLALAGAAFQRAQKIPRLDEVMGTNRQTPEQQETMWRHIANVNRLKVKRHNPRRVRIVRVH